MFYILIILIFIRPFISSLAFPYLNLIYSVLLLGFLFIWVFLKGLPLKEIKPIRYPLALFILALIISIMFSFDKINSVEELYKYITAILIFLIGIALSDKDKTQVIRAIILAGFIISILAIYQYFFGFKHILNYIAKEKISAPFALDYIMRKRAFFPFVTPNALAGYLIIIVPLVLLIKGRTRWIILLPISVALLLTKSLGAFFSLFLGLGLYLYLRKDLPRKKFALLVIVAVCSVFIFILRQTATKEYILPIFSLLKRLGYWQDTLEIIKAHPFVGIGIGNFNLAQSRYTHNSYLQIWAEMGIFGLISFLWIVGSIFKSGFQNINISPYKKQIAGPLTVNVVFLIHNFIDFTFFLPEVAFIWWVLLGIILFKKK